MLLTAAVFPNYYIDHDIRLLRLISIHMSFLFDSKHWYYGPCLQHIFNYILVLQLIRIKTTIAKFIFNMYISESYEHQVSNFNLHLHAKHKYISSIKKSSIFTTFKQNIFSLKENYDKHV